MKHYILVGLCFPLAAAAGACTLSTAPAASAPKTVAASNASIRNSCIDPRLIDSQTIVSDQEIQFKMRNGDVWTNKLPTACFGLKIEGGFGWEIRGTLACSNQERITVRETGVTCLIGEFTRTTS